MTILRYLSTVVFFLCATVATFSQDAGPSVVTQFATIDSLVAGVYDGFVSLGELKRSGDLGIGTFDRIDGEGVVLNGEVYQVRSDGRVYRPSDETTTPFASVVKFAPTRRVELDAPCDYDGLRRAIDSVEPSPNKILAIRARGVFEDVLVRSSYAQTRPYPPLEIALANQPEFEISRAEGELVGFRLPPYVKGLNVPGLHLHFIDAARERGGHLLKLRMLSGTIEIMEIDRFLVVAPPADSDFYKTDLSVDRTKETERVELSR